MVDFVRKEFPAQTFHIDCEGGLGLQHMEMLYRLDDFSLAMIEQPLPADDLVGHAMVQDSVRTPICLDEGITSVAQAEMALELHSCKYVNLKPSRVGGLTAAVAIHDVCHAQCTPCWVGACRRAQSAHGSASPWPPKRTARTHPTIFLPIRYWPRTWPSRCCPVVMRPTAGNGCGSGRNRESASNRTARFWRSIAWHTCESENRVSRST